MININNKSWHKLRFNDILCLLKEDDDENFFFEYKNDDIKPEKLIKEICAFSNTYGGYVLLGIDDDKTISGCKIWTEQKIHTAVHDLLTPVPIFDVRKFKTTDGLIIFVIKVEEGPLPPYITNKGSIYERISSGSYSIKDSAKLTQLYYKRTDQIKRIENKLYIDPIEKCSSYPSNLCGYLDVGFSIECSNQDKMIERFRNLDIERIAKNIKTNNFSISRLGLSYQLSIGELSDQSNQQVWKLANMHNFIHIMPDGSTKFRIMLFGLPNHNKVDIVIISKMLMLIEDIYKSFFDKQLAKDFICAHKYEKLTVINQFIPYYDLPDPRFEEYCDQHKNKYGGNIIVSGNRIPKNDFNIIDRRAFEENGIKYTYDNLVKQLISIHQISMGFIDLL